MHSIDHQLLFAVLALQLEFITPAQFIELCTVWASRKDQSFGDLLAERGWVNSKDVQDIERLLARKLARHDGDATAGLREAGADARVHATLAGIDDDVLLSLGYGPQRVSLISTHGQSTESLGRYTLSHVHATGGMGRVWLAHDASLRREVALKELRPDRPANPIIQSRFVREAQVTGQLEHPGIVPIYEIGRRPDDDSPYYTMRFLRGKTLAEAADAYHARRKKEEEGPLELRQLLGAFVGVCNAIAYAHSRGVLHRDLKPQNVILGNFGEVMVLDWGLARVEEELESGPRPIDLESTDDADATRTGQVLGTPGYMAPEQAMGRHDLLGPRTDVFGLGATLYHILANRPPFTASTREDAIRNAIETPIPPLAEFGVDSIPALEAVCRKAMEKEIDDRYESATALADEVQRWLADEPVRVFPDPLHIRTARWVRRHRTLAAAASVFFVCGVVALAVITAMIWRQQQETDRHLARTAEFASRIVEAADAGQGNASQVRMAMAQTGVGLMRDLRRERPDDGRLVSTLARLLQFDATAKRLAGRYSESQLALKEATLAIEPFLEKDPESQTYRSVLAACHFNLGAVQMVTGQRREAAANHERAIKLYEGAAKTDRLARFHQAVAANELSLVQFGWKPMEEVEKSSRQAVAMLGELVREGSIEESPVVALLLSGALNRTAQCVCELNRPIEGLRLTDESAKIMDAVLAQRPADRDALHFRAHCWLARAKVCAAIPGRVQDALFAYEKAISLWTRLIAQGSETTAYRFVLAQALARRADFHRRNGRRVDAETDAEAAHRLISLLPNPEQISVEYHLSRALLSDVGTRIAIDAKDMEEARKHLAAARASYAALLAIDPDNELERDALEKLESDAQAAGI